MCNHIPAFLRCGLAQTRPTLARAASLSVLVRKRKSPPTVATPEKLLAAVFANANAATGYKHLLIG